MQVWQQGTCSAGWVNELRALSLRATGCSRGAASHGESVGSAERDTIRFQRSHLDWFKKQVPTAVLAFPAPARPTHRRVPMLYVPKAGVVQHFVLIS